MITYVVQIEYREDTWVNVSRPYLTSPEADNDYEFFVRRFPNRKVRIVECKTTETNVRRNFL